jgi:hypothetical protein
VVDLMVKAANMEREYEWFSIWGYDRLW